MMSLTFGLFTQVSDSGPSCYFYLSKKIRLDFSCDSLMSLKNSEKIFINVVCCSCDWRFKG